MGLSYLQETLVRGCPEPAAPWSNHARCLRLPMFKRSAIQANGMVVLERNSLAYHHRSRQDIECASSELCAGTDQA
jgi:hypothetical protein